MSEEVENVNQELPEGVFLKEGVPHITFNGEDYDVGEGVHVIQDAEETRLVHPRALGEDN